MDLERSDQKVAFLMDQFPTARHNYLYLILSYWQVFDGIEIPQKLLLEIAEKATQPETITRARRRVLEQHRFKTFLELQRMAKDKGTGKGDLS